MEDLKHKEVTVISREAMRAATAVIYFAESDGSIGGMRILREPLVEPANGEY